MFGALLVLCLLPQEPDLAAVQQSQAARIATIARCAPAVCSVMDMTSPGGGSGVIIDPHGFVLTNFHVVGAADPKYKLPDPPEPPDNELAAWKAAHPDADEAAQKQFVDAWKQQWRDENQPQGKDQFKNKKVGLPDGQLYEAEVLGVDPGSDLGLLRILPKQPGQTWPSVPLGDSDALLEGQTVFAMGNPFLLATDFTPTVTFGIVSGTHRYQEGQGNRMLVYPDCIQVDAPVNPGNSGGPLFNEAGEVIGINGRISIGDRGRVNVGVGFAIASNQIRNFLPDLLAGRHAEHGTLDMSAWYMAAPREESRRRGVFVQQLFRDSVVAEAGIGLGDELTTFNGTEIRTANQLATLIGVLPAGTWVSVGYKPAQTEGGYGEERTVIVKMVPLDTGSSTDARADTERLASRADRRLATQALLQSWRLSADPSTPSGRCSRARPAGPTVRMLRDGERLRIELSDRVLVRTGNDTGFCLVDAKVRELAAEERALLDRELQANPFLWRGSPARQLQDALLLGGVMVDGIPAYRFALPGDTDLEAWYFEGGIPAGYALRDPLQKVRLEVRLREQSDDASLSARFREPTHLRVITDGKCELGWQPTAPIDAADPTALDALFRRPQ